MSGAKIGDDDYRSILAFRDQLRRFLHWSEEQAHAAGITPAQHQLLLSIRGHSGSPPTVGEIAEHLQLRHHSAVGLIDRAEAAGLVVRVADAVDGRVVRVTLKDAGREALEELTGHHLDELRLLADTFAALEIPGGDHVPRTQTE